MNTKLIVPIMISVLLCCSISAWGQDVNERKIKRIIRKIERQQEKLRELQGHEIEAFNIVVPRVDPVRPEGINEDVMIIRKKAFEEQKKAMEQQQQEMKEQVMIMKEDNLKKLQELKELGKLKELEELGELEEIPELNEEKLKEIQEEMKVWKDDSGKIFYYKSPEFKFKGVEPFVWKSPEVMIDVPEFKAGVYNWFSDQDALCVEKTLDGESLTADFSYEVKPGATGISLSVNGSMEAGSVVITVKKPDGTVFNTYNLSPLANVHWNQILKFEDQEEAAFVGKWTLTIAADGAKGKYQVRINDR